MKELTKEQYNKINRARGMAADMRRELENGTFVADPDDVLEVVDAFLDLVIASEQFRGYPGSNGGF